MKAPTQKTMTVRCQISGKQLPLDAAVPVDLIRDSLVETMKEVHPDLDVTGYVGLEELDKARIMHVEKMSQKEQDSLADLRKEVAESLLRQEVITRDIDREFD